MRLVSIVSARPNFVKLAAVHHAIEQGNQREASSGQHLEHIIVHTGQHYDPLLSEVFFQELGIPKPDENLGVKGGVSNEDTVSRTKEAVLPVLKKLSPDLVLVYGDVSGALGGAQAAHECKIPVAHIEAGLRSFDDTMPEERNRIAIDRIAKLLFVTEKSGIENLENENVTEGVHFVGNTMIDILGILKRLKPIMEEQLPKLPGGRYAVATIHRPSNVDDPTVLRGLIEFMKEVAELCPIVLPVHPRLQIALNKIDFSLDESGPPLLLVESTPYIQFHFWLAHSAFILTDSGGIQEEAVFHGKRCFTLRKNTERPSTIDAGSNVLIDLEKSEDREKVLSYAKDPKPIQVAIPELWDGKAGERIVEVLRKQFS